MPTWAPKYLRLDQEVLELMVAQQWVTQLEVDLWLEDQLAEPALSQLEQRLHLARLHLDPTVPVQ